VRRFCPGVRSFATLRMPLMLKGLQPRLGKGTEERESGQKSDWGQVGWVSSQPRRELTGGLAAL